MRVAEAASGTFTNDGLNLAYRKFGGPGGVPVILLHGLLYFSYDWIPIATALAQDREVAALDQRGFGDFDRSKSQKYETRDFAADVIGLLDHLGWERCVLVGHSMGGRNAACAAITYPDRVAALVLADSPPQNAATGARRIGDQMAGTPSLFRTVDDALRYFPATPWKDKLDPERRRRFESYLRPVDGGFEIKRDPHFHRLFFRLKASWPYHSYEPGTWPIGREFDMWRALEGLRCPTLVMVGRAGDLFSPEAEQRVDRIARETNPQLRLVTYLCHHNMPGRIPGQLIADIANVCAAADRTTPAQLGSVA